VSVRVLAVVLAGGRARRMGGRDKALLELGGRPLVEHVIARLRPQVDALILNANGDPGRFARFGLEVVADPVAGHQGPLAGILAALDWARRRAPDVGWVVSAATDTPFLPLDLVARLLEAVHREGTALACAASGGRTHPVFGLWPVALCGALRTALVTEGVRKIDLFTARYPLSVVDWPARPADPFFNVNRPEDLAHAAARLRAGGDGGPLSPGQDRGA